MKLYRLTTKIDKIKWIRKKIKTDNELRSNRRRIVKDTRKPLPSVFVFREKNLPVWMSLLPVWMSLLLVWMSLLPVWMFLGWKPACLDVSSCLFGCLEAVPACPRQWRCVFHRTSSGLFFLSTFSSLFFSSLFCGCSRARGGSPKKKEKEKEK